MAKSDREMIDEMDAIMKEGAEAEHFAPLKARPSRKLTVTYAIRLSPEEYEAFNRAAKSRGMTLADFMRSASRGAITGEIDVERAAALSDAQEKARDLADTLSRL